MENEQACKKNIIKFFDEVYSNYERYWWREDTRYSIRPEDYQGAPRKLIEILAVRPHGIALDLGAGEGADSIRLARMGYHVDAIEASVVGIEKIRRFAYEAGVHINLVHADVREYEPMQQYDVIICNGVLHYIQNKALVLQRMQEATKIGGINMISLFTNFTPIPEVHQVTEVYCDAENGIAYESYRYWKHHYILFERDKWDTKHPDFPPHRHSMLKIVAEKFETES